MLKIVTTQLQGLFQRIAKNEEENIEDTARLLAQAGVGEGNIYFACFDEFQAIMLQATNDEPFYKMLPYTDSTVLSPADRVCIFTKTADDEAAIDLASTLDVPYAVIASEVKNGENRLFEESYTYVNLQVRGGLIPGETGERFLQPDLFAALFVYEAIKLSFNEMMDC